jgi:hypothetical protein
MAGPKNSPVSDALPYDPPKTRAPKKMPDNDWAKLGKSGQYPEINEYLESRKRHFSRYLPSGEPIQGLTKKERSDAWDNAVLIIGEIEGIQNKIALEVVASKQKPVA